MYYQNIILVIALLANIAHSLTGTFLHITDLHIDPDYRVGSPTQCLLGKTGLGCCRKNDMPLKDNYPAGIWGDKNCDLPVNTFNKTLQYISENHKLDFILYGGDTVGHHDLSQSLNKNLETIRLVNNLFYYYFRGTPFCPNQGNHDTYPIDQTLPLLERKIRNSIANSWIPLIGHNAAESFIYGGFLETKISDNLTVISLDSISYDSHNAFKKKTIDGSDLDIWLNNTLSEITNNNGKAIILGHIYPSSGESITLYNNWLLDYLQEFRDVVVSSHFGHSHNDEFRLVLDNNTKNKVVTVPILVSPSLMADMRDPCYRLYKYDKNTNTLLDYHQYCIDLALTNKENNLNIYLDYSFKDIYGENNITRISFQNILAKLKNNTNNVLTKYCRKYIGNNHQLLDKCNNVGFRQNLLSKITL